MKTKIIFFTLLFISSVSAQIISEAKAREILGSRFINVNEVQLIYPDWPTKLPINYSEKTLRNCSKYSWLMPTKNGANFKYLLIQQNFECEIAANKKTPLLPLETVKEILILLNKLRPTFPNRTESTEHFKYFFRSNNYSFTKGRIVYQKAVSYDGQNFITINWPNEVELGVVNQEYIYYLTRDHRGVEKKLGLELLPSGHSKVKNQSIFVLTLWSI